MSVDLLSDSELRSKLAEYGYPVGPVTLTTRKILVKKLKALIEARESGASRTTATRHSLAARYSSDDTDDDTVQGTGRNKKKSGSSRRQTMANPMPPPPSAPPAAPRSPAKRRTPVRVPTIQVDESATESEAYVRQEPAQRDKMRSLPEVVPSSIKSTKSVQRKVTKIFTSTSTENDGLETGSDSDVNDEPEKMYGAKKFVINGPKTYDSGLSDPGVSDYEPTVKPYEPKQRSVFTMREEGFSAPVFKPNVSPILPVKDDGYGRESKNRDDPLANVETPYLSDFTRRLSRLSSANLPAVSRTGSNSPILRQTSTSVVPDVKETDSNGHFTLRSTYPYSTTSSRYTTSPIDRPRDIVTRAFQPTTESKDAKNNQNFISMVLVAVVALFFAVLAVMYLGLGGKTETFPPELSDNNIPLCTANQPDSNRPGVHCVMREHLESVQRLLKALQPILTQKAISAACDNPNEVPYLTDKNVISMFSSKDVWEVKQDLHNAQVLIFHNPKWGISIVEVDESDKTSMPVLESMEKVFLNRVDGKVGIVILNPELPMKCLAANKLYTVLSSLLVVAFGLLIAIGTHKSVIWYLKYKKRLESDVFHLVSEIITTLELHHQNAAAVSPGGSQESYLAISHVRDNLIPPKDRKRMAALWQKAVQFLDENESRVRKEVQQVAGEEFHVWRWLPSNNLNASNVPAGSPANKKTKVWQGQAFETMEGSVNSLPCSPTPCLKIRHMFDPDVEFEEDWETKVQDAILEKCGEDVKILHIRVDRGSREGCVYMKCMSQEDAGKAYRALHGWWFDSNLVTVKYLRLERYHERFPDAMRCVTPLKPSNNQRLSMPSRYWQSPLETN